MKSIFSKENKTTFRQKPCKTAASTAVSVTLYAATAFFITCAITYTQPFQAYAEVPSTPFTVDLDADSDTGRVGIGRAATGPPAGIANGSYAEDNVTADTTPEFTLINDQAFGAANQKVHLYYKKLSNPSSECSSITAPTGTVESITDLTEARTTDVTTAVTVGANSKYNQSMASPNISSRGDGAFCFFGFLSVNGTVTNSSVGSLKVMIDTEGPSIVEGEEDGVSWGWIYGDGSAYQDATPKTFNVHENEAYAKEGDFLVFAMSFTENLNSFFHPVGGDVQDSLTIQIKPNTAGAWRDATIRSAAGAYISGSFEVLAGDKGDKLLIRMPSGVYDRAGNLNESEETSIVDFIPDGGGRSGKKAYIDTTPPTFEAAVTYTGAREVGDKKYLNTGDKVKVTLTFSEPIQSGNIIEGKFQIEQGGTVSDIPSIGTNRHEVEVEHLNETTQSIELTVRERGLQVMDGTLKYAITGSLPDLAGNNVEISASEIIENTIIKTTRPTATVTVTYQDSETHSGVTYLNAGDTVRVSVNFDSAVSSATEVTAQLRNTTNQAQIATASVSSLEEETSAVFDFTIPAETGNVAKNNVLFVITTPSSISSPAGPQLQFSPHTINNVVIDTEAPTAVRVALTTKRPFEDNAYINKEENDSHRTDQLVGETAAQNHQASSDGFAIITSIEACGGTVTSFRSKTALRVSEITRDGMYRICYRAMDLAGNAIYAQSAAFTRDVIVPTISERTIETVGGVPDDTTAPTEQSPRFLSENDSVTISFDFSEPMTSGDVEIDLFKNRREFTGEEAARTTPDGDQNTKKAQFTFGDVGVVRPGDIQYDITNEDEITDLAGNPIETQATRTIGYIGIDTTPPVVQSAITADISRTQIRVTMSSPVFAESKPNASDFKIVINNTEYAARGISGLPQSINQATPSFIISHPQVSASATIKLKYTKRVGAITNVAGNSLENFSDFEVVDAKFVRAVLDAQDDTGLNNDDGITRLDGEEVTIKFSISSGTFLNGDEVHLYKNNEETPIKTYLISNQIIDAIAATGQTSFTGEVPRGTFATNAVTNIQATYTAAGGTTTGRGPLFAVRVETEPPTITVGEITPSGNHKRQKTVQATDDESGNTVWKYKKIIATEQCDERAMRSDTEAYTEGEDLRIAGNDDNGKKVCFSSTDLAGNIAYEESGTITGIDVTPPSVISASVTNNGRTETEVVFDEAVYALPSTEPANFKILVGGTERPITGLTIAQSAANAETTATLRHTSVGQGGTVTLRYSQRSGAVVDQAGNAMNEITTGIPVSNIPFVTILLDQRDDTGADNEDRVTRFSGDDISFTITRTNGTFAEGDNVQIYRVEDGSVLKSVVVTTRGGADAVRAVGASQFSITIPKNMILEGVVTLYAEYTPAGSTRKSRGMSTTITYDKTKPTITVQDPEEGTARQKTIRATDSETTPTVWKYKRINGREVCDEAVMRAETQDYTEGGQVQIESDEDNGRKICFSASDSAGNIAYKASGIIAGLDTTAPEFVSAVIVNFERTETKMTFSKPVYTESATISPADFKVVVEGVQYPATGIEIAESVASANRVITLNHAPIASTENIEFSYIQGTQKIIDSIGNRVASFSEKTATSRLFVYLDLAEEDDTGREDDDNYTKLDGDEATIIASIRSETFSSGDQVTVYAKGTAVKTMTIGTVFRNAVDAAGSSSFHFEIPRDVFSGSGVTSLTATYQPAGEVVGDQGEALEVTIDTREPVITIRNPNTRPETRKRVRATDSDRNNEDTVWFQKKIADDVDCDEDSMAEGADEYDEGEYITLDDEADNGMRICFSSEDRAGNISFRRSTEIEGIDSASPTVSTAMVTGATEITVTMTEPVYSSRGPGNRNFVVYVAGAEVSVSEISGIPSSQRQADNEFTITLEESIATADNTITLSYTTTGVSGDRRIKDAIGNTLVDFTDVEVTFPSAIEVVFSEKSIKQAGQDESEGVYLNTAERQVTFKATIEDGVFRNGDRIRLYRNNEEESFHTVTIGVRSGQVRANNAQTLEFSVPTSKFKEGEMTLRTTFTKRSNQREGFLSAPTIVTVDTTAPTITINGPGEGFGQKTVSATDDEGGQTTWTYAEIAGNETCTAQAGNPQPYTEGTQLEFSEEQHNGNAICFTVTDSTGNTATGKSAVIEGIDITAPTITINGPGQDRGQKTVSATDDEEGQTTWTYSVIAGGDVCTPQAGASQEYVEESQLIFDQEQHNGSAVCFTVTDGAGNIATGKSAIIEGIDITPPTITINGPEQGFGQKTVSATDDEDERGQTIWTYAVIAEHESCAPQAETPQEYTGDVAFSFDQGTQAGIPQIYTEGSQLIFDQEQHNGNVVCFMAIDNAGNIAASKSAVIEGIDTTAPTITINGPGEGFGQKTVSATDDEEEQTTWTYSVIARDETCTAQAGTPQSYTEGVQLEFSEERHNGNAICFTVTDSAGNTATDASAVIEGIDITAPTITINGPGEGFGQKTVSATDDEEEQTTWTYSVITESEECTAQAGTPQSYTEGARLVFNEEQHNGSAACFTVTDSAGNTATGKSATIEGIDITAPAITIDGPEQGFGQKTVSATDDEGGQTTWTYAEIAGGETCTAQAGNPQPYTEGTQLEFSEEQHNGNAICFTVTDSTGNTATGKSAVIEGIDSIAPEIIIENPNTSPASKKTIRASDGSDEKTVWKYKVVQEGVTCNEREMQSGSKDYNEGSGLSFTEEKANGFAVCFQATDEAGNTAYAISEEVQGIRAIELIITIDGPGQGFGQKTVSATDNKEGQTTWTYAEIAGGETCTAQAGNPQPYTEGDQLEFSEEQHNGNAICFTVIDSTGNTATDKSPTIEGIDTTAPTITIDGPEEQWHEQKTVSATDNEEGQTTWTYAVIARDETCTLQTGNQKDYTEGNQLVFDQEKHNGSTVCFTVTDGAGNTATGASAVIEGIGTEAPATASFTGVNKISIAFDRPVYALRPNVSDFLVQAGGRTLEVIAIEGLARTQQTAVKSFNLVLAENVSASAGVTVIYENAYSNDNERIKDSAGRSIAPFEELVARATDVGTGTRGTPILGATGGVVSGGSGTSNVTMALSQRLDTGDDNTDGITNFGGEDSIIFTVTLTSGSFVNGDRVQITGERQQVLATKTIGLNALGSVTTNITLQKSVFNEGINTLTASHIKRQAGEGVGQSNPIVITYDITNPTIDIENPNSNPSSSKTVRAYTGEQGVKMQYKKIDGEEECNERIMRYGLKEEYAEGDGLILNDEDDNGMAMCFVASDKAGNTVYGKSEVINGIETSEPRLFSDTVIPKQVTENEISFTFNSTIAGEITYEGKCVSRERVAIVGDNTITFVNLADGVYDDCALVITSEAGNQSEPLQIEPFIIDTVAPVITVDNPDGSPATKKVVRASDESDDETAWKYKVIQKGVLCDREEMQTDARWYDEGSGLAFDEEQANNFAVCFQATDKAGNTAYAISEVIQGIDTTAPNISISEPDTEKVEKVKRVSASQDGGSTIKEWSYKKISEEKECDQREMKTGAKEYNEGETITLKSKNDNGKRICFMAIDDAGNATFKSSETVTGIDTEAPEIRIDGPTSGASAKKVITATAVDDSETTWKYKVIKSNGKCDSHEMNTKVFDYAEGSGLVFRSARANGYKICFQVTDSAGHESYAESKTMKGIDQTRPEFIKASVVGEGKVKLTLSKEVYATGEIQTRDFNISNDDGAQFDVTAISIPSSKSKASDRIDMEFSGRLIGGEILTLRYIKSAGSKEIKDVAGNNLTKQSINVTVPVSCSSLLVPTSSILCL